ncbi:hypothetical protein R1sor_015656 [Riccia sorocarpa]|uniref:Uncharacterized protein n=1 Tax=Riccia sorocarpa TaxID=122646 RepID=A0ABD3HFJ2_9MARC
MAASATKTVMSLGSVVAPSSLSSRSAFAASPIVSVAPCKSARAAPLTVRASAAEEPKAGRREMLASLLAAGTVLSTGSAALAGGIPDVGAGAKKLTKKATQALENSPIPSSGGRIEGGLKDKNQARLANQSAIPARVKETPGQRVDPLENGPIAGNSLGEAADNVKGGIEDLTKNGPDKVKRDVKTAGSKVASNTGIGKKNLGQKGGDVADQVSSAGEKGKGVIGNIKDKITDALPQ